ncbi:MAG: hydrolase [Rhizobiales bacterium]|nr:hydrolase [Hyphomicrobiales bacterium]
MSIFQKAETLKPIIAGRVDEIEVARRLPADLAGMMAEQGLFRMMVPKSLGGLELEAAEALAILETIGAADASVGWCLMIGSTTGLCAAYLPHETAHEIYGGATTITGGVFAPMGKAVVEGENYRLNGRWQWASGSANCSWLMGGAVILEDGKPRLLPNGMPDSRMLVFPAGDAELIDSWHVSGLCGTGSGDMAVNDLVVPRARSISLIVDKPVEEGPLYRFPIFGLLALGIAAVMMGNARASIEALTDLAGGKKAPGARKSLAERTSAQAELAKAEAQLRGARAYYYDAVGAAWKAAARGEALDVEARAGLRLAATHATRISADVTRVMYDLGGGSSVFLGNALQRKFRDGHVGTQHVMVAPATYELTGRVFMGLPTDASML